MLNFSDYQQAVLRTESREPHPERVVTHWRTLHGAIGLATEAGELLDQMKKVVFYGRELDQRNLREEIGDVMWYVALLCDANGFDLAEILAANQAKLEARYQGQFSLEKAENRNLDAEMAALDGR